MTTEILKKWICTKPFNYLDVQPEGKAYMCCPSWLPEDITEGGTKTITEGWFGEKSEAIRASILDGSFKYCDHKVCPEISAVLAGDDRDGKSSYMFLKENYEVPKVPMVEDILYGQDRSCNLRCPSCRLNVIPNARVDSPEHQQKQAIQDEIEEQFGGSIQKIMLTGSGDPMYSKIYRDFLINFDKTKYPNMEQIQIVTNGVLLNEKMWNSFNCKEFIKIFDISFDAGSKFTFENSTRIGGDWDRMISNIRYLISQTDIIRKFIFSYVVSEYNFREMKQCLDIIDELTDGSEHKVVVNFRQHLFWDTGAYTKDQVNEIAVFDPDHLCHAEFLEQLKIMTQHPAVNHNFHHLL
jgi:sulfatase maturation enzyme AslB (radical SAM superfamily)